MGAALLVQACCPARQKDSGRGGGLRKFLNDDMKK